MILGGLAGTSVGYRQLGDHAVRILPPTSFRTTWAPQPPPRLESPTSNPELAGGDWQHGHDMFYGEKLKCYTCHKIRGEGNTVAPDLSNLVSRDVVSVLRDIKDPSATINPDYVAFNVALKDGDEVTGFVRAQKEDAITILGINGKETVIPRKNIDVLRASAVSLMPTGLLDGVKESEIRDLLTLLLNEPPHRTSDEVAKLVQSTGLVSATNNATPLNVVLVASKQDHGPGQHDYPAWQKNWNPMLNSFPGVTATNAWEWPSAQQFQTANLMVFYFWNHNWSKERLQQLDDYLARGGGVVCLHAGVIADKDPEQLAERIGLSSLAGKTKYRHMPFDLKVASGNDITRGLPEKLHLLDEPYWGMFGDASKVHVLATVAEDGKDQPVAWTFEKGKGRVFATVLGHYRWTLDDPYFRVLVGRGMAWAANVPLQRFDQLPLKLVEKN